MADRIAGLIQRQLESFSAISQANNRITSSNGDHPFETVIDTQKEDDRIEAHIPNLEIADGARYEYFPTAECLKGTRTNLLSLIIDWTTNRNGKLIFWLCGMAGTGKSTIARTISSRLSHEKRLGASFFFKRGEGDRGNASRLFSTLSSQFACILPGFGQSVRKALKSDPQIGRLNLQIQFEKLLLEPLIASNARDPALASQLTIVIDALDECGPDRVIDDAFADYGAEYTMQTILGLLARLKLHVFVTSRPELPVQLGFKKMGHVHEDVVLEEVPPEVIECDIHLYLKHKLEEIRAFNNNLANADILLDHWPGNDIIDALVKLAVPLFIFAATICRYIRTAYEVQKNLNFVLELRDQDNSMKDMGLIYAPVLAQMIESLRGLGVENEEAMRRFRRLLGSIVLLASPLSITALSSLLKMSSDSINQVLVFSQAVIQVPTSKSSPVRLLHLSFREFLVDKDSGVFSINKEDANLELAKCCLELLTEGLREDICRLGRPGALRNTVTQDHIDISISADVAYACQFWMHHIIEAFRQPLNSRRSLRDTMIQDGGQVYRFLKRGFLSWLEALSWLGRLSDAINDLDLLQELVKKHGGSALLAFIGDAYRFILENRQIIETSPLQLYYSAVFFSPEQCSIRQAFAKSDTSQGRCSHRSDEVFDLLPDPPTNWSVRAEKVQGHAGKIRAIAFSPVDKLVATASDDGSVRLWNSHTGEAVSELQGHTAPVGGIAFAPNGKSLASTSFDESLRVWSTRAGTVIHNLALGKLGVVNSVTFLHDGQVIAALSDDRVLRLWDANTGSEMSRIKRFKKPLNSLVFTSDGSMMASAWGTVVQLWNACSFDGMRNPQKLKKPITALALSPDGGLAAAATIDMTISLWDTKTGKTTQNLDVQSGITNALAFSPDGNKIASASQDCAIRIWDCQIDRHIRTLRGHKTQESRAWVEAVSFSPDGNIIASSSKATMKLWTGWTNEVQEEHEGPEGCSGRRGAAPALTLSPSGKIMASACGVMICLWNARTGKQTKALAGHTNWITSLAFSSDGKVLASGSQDKSILLWNPRSGEQIHQFKEPSMGAVNAVVFSPREDTLLSASEDRKIRLWSLSTSAEARLLQGGNVQCGTRAASVIVSPDGSMVASTSGKIVRLWSILNGQEIQVLEGHTDRVCTVAFSPSSRLMVSGSKDCSVRLWDLNRELEDRSFAGHTDDIRAVAVSPDGDKVASASNDNTIRLWRVHTGRQIAMINTISTVDRLVFSKGGNTILANVGVFHISPNKASPEDDMDLVADIGLDGQWVQIRGQNIFWLPHEYQGTCATAYGNTLSIGQESGAVSFYRLAKNISKFNRSLS